jgi:hypothetical protein
MPRSELNAGPQGGAVRRKRSVLLSLVLVVASFMVVGARKILEYAAAPDRDKESDFLFPHNADQGKPAVLISEPKAPPVSFKQLGGFTNDASHLNKTAIYGVVRITNEDDIRNALQFARENNLKVTCAGQQHSMGGQTFIHGGLILDLRDFNQIKLDKPAQDGQHPDRSSLVAASTTPRQRRPVGEVHAVHQHLQRGRVAQRQRP